MSRLLIILGLLMGVGLVFIRSENKIANKSNSELKQITEEKNSLAKVALVPGGNEKKQGMPAQKRFPASATSLDQLQAASAQPWTIEYSSHGEIRALRGGSYASPKKFDGDFLQAAHEFLKEYSSLLGLSPNSHSLVRLDKNADFPSVIFQQSIAGFPVFGSRIAIFFNQRGDITMVQSDIYSGAHEIAPQISREQVIGLAINYLQQSSLRATFSYREMEASLQYGALLSGDILANVYKFNLFINNQYAFGDYEMLLSADSGALIRLKLLSKK